MQSGWKDAQGAQVTAVGCPDCLKVWGKVVLKHQVQQVEVCKVQSVNISPTVWKPGDGASWLVVVRDADVNAIRGLRCRVVKVQVSEGEFALEEPVVSCSPNSSRTRRCMSVSRRPQIRRSRRRISWRRAP